MTTTKDSLKSIIILVYTFLKIIYVVHFIFHIINFSIVIKRVTVNKKPPIFYFILLDLPL